MRRLPALVVLAASLVGCGGAPPKPATEPASAQQPSAAPRNGVAVSAEVGALDEEATRKSFERATKTMTRCFQKGTERVPFLAGDVAFYVRVAGDGSAKYVFLRDSTLGDRATEECMLRALREAAWPAPVGGAEGEAKNDFHFEPGSDERPPVTWHPGQLGAPFRNAQRALQECRRGAGAGPMKATLYVDTEGKPLAVGVSVSDEKGERAAPCVVEALKGLTYPSPGSYAAKATVSID